MEWFGNVMGDAKVQIKGSEVRQQRGYRTLGSSKSWGLKVSQKVKAVQGQFGEASQNKHCSRKIFSKNAIS